MPDTIVFEPVNLEAFQRAARLAPKKVYGNIRQEFRRAGNKFGTKARRQLLFGQAIHLPAHLLETTTRGKNKGKVKARKHRTGDVRSIQKQHIIVRTGGKDKAIFLVVYTSKFLTYHEGKIRDKLAGMFRREARLIAGRVEKEAARTIQRVFDEGLRDKGRGRAGNPTRRLSTLDFDRTILGGADFG